MQEEAAALIAGLVFADDAAPGATPWGVRAALAASPQREQRGARKGAHIRSASYV